MSNSAVLMNVAALDAISRAVGNVGVPAAIAFLVLWQVTPRLDAQTIALQQLNTAVAVQTAACAPGRGDLR